MTVGEFILSIVQIPDIHPTVLGNYDFLLRLTFLVRKKTPGLVGEKQPSVK
jgi:hypothetical protein